MGGYRVDICRNFPEWICNPPEGTVVGVSFGTTEPIARANALTNAKNMAITQQCTCSDYNDSYMQGGAELYCSGGKGNAEVTPLKWAIYKPENGDVRAYVLVQLQSVRCPGSDQTTEMNKDVESNKM